jgi:hypothetical protein
VTPIEKRGKNGLKVLCFMFRVSQHDAFYSKDNIRVDKSFKIKFQY